MVDRNAVHVIWIIVSFRHKHSSLTADGEVQQTSGGHCCRENTGPSSGETEDGSAVVQ